MKRGTQTLEEHDILLFSPNTPIPGRKIKENLEFLNQQRIVNNPHSGLGDPFNNKKGPQRRPFELAASPLNSHDGRRTKDHGRAPRDPLHPNLSLGLYAPSPTPVAVLQHARGRIEERTKAATIWAMNSISKDCRKLAGNHSRMIQTLTNFCAISSLRRGLGRRRKGESEMMMKRGREMRNEDDYTYMN